MTSSERPEPSPHEPVLRQEILEFFYPGGHRTGGIRLDATVGLAGHASGILELSAPEGRLVGLDRDPTALALARSALAGYGDRVMLVHAPFSQLDSALDGVGVGEVDGILADLGVSSPQLDRAERGFSFQRSGPLDMRMDTTTGETAAEVLARTDERELAGWLRDYGEERMAGRIARRIIEARDRGELDSTGALAAVVHRALPGGARHKNPATRTFQALRIVVNDELAELETFLEKAPARLAVGGRLCVISFHSLEDRLVKRRFRALAEPSRSLGWSGAAPHAPAPAPASPRFQILTKRPVIATEAEQDRNPRSRSAKLRVLERVA
ncbi:MAG TPA: 16S rRNA (cytosine(1402)-N(4))-methyltransferase RsmH [Polyangia bacterium]